MEANGKSCSTSSFPRPALKRTLPDEPGGSYSSTYQNKRQHTASHPNPHQDVAIIGYSTVSSESPSRETAYVGTFTHYRPMSQQAVNNSTAQKRGWVYFDGGSRGNPGPAGCGALVHMSQDSGTHMPSCNDAAFLGIKTNNEAEYEGLILGLLLALQEGCTHVHVKGDSMLVINQLNRKWQVKNPRLEQLWGTAHRLLARFASWDASHVYRDANKQADVLANTAMDSCNPGRGVPSSREALW